MNHEPTCSGNGTWPGCGTAYKESHDTGFIQSSNENAQTFYDAVEPAKPCRVSKQFASFRTWIGRCSGLLY